jgi:hypothetical protein
VHQAVTVDTVCKLRDSFEVFALSVSMEPNGFDRDFNELMTHWHGSTPEEGGGLSTPTCPPNAVAATDQPEFKGLALVD